MKDSKMIALLALLCAVQARYTTYEPVVEQLYFLGNDIRKTPTMMEDKLEGADLTYLKTQDKAKNLEWSDGLSRSCRDLVLDIGPFGLEGSVTSTGKD
jgi:hypothetical protein